jgi:nicotinamidase-related amidase
LHTVYCRACFQTLIMLTIVVCSPGGYMEYQGYDISAAQSLIPKLQQVLNTFRTAGFPVYHTREGKPHNLVLMDSD